MEIVCNNGKIKQLFYKNGEKTGQAKPDEDNPRIFLRKLIEANKSPVLSEMPPFTGGLVGYFAYDYLKYGEPKLKLTNKETLTIWTRCCLTKRLSLIITGKNHFDSKRKSC